MTDKLTQTNLDRVLSFASADTPAIHDDLAIQYTLWYGLNVTVWLAVVIGHETEAPLRMREWRHYLEAIGFT